MALQDNDRWDIQEIVYILKDVCLVGLCTVFVRCILYIVYSILYTVYCIQYIVYSLLYTVYCIQYICLTADSKYLEKTT